MTELLTADLIITNGNIITVDESFSIAQAVAVRGDKIVAVGTSDEIKALAGKATKYIDLKGRTMLPGINDAHTHTALWAGARPPLVIDLNYPAVKSKKDIVAAVAEKVKTVKPGEWIRGFGWNEGFLEECVRDKNTRLTKHDLDPVSPDNPVCLCDFSVHNLWVNSQVLELAGITQDTSVPQGSEIVKDPETGEPTGMILEFGAQSPIMKVMPPFTKMQKREAIITAIKELNSLGITSITEAALGPGGTRFQGGLLDSECISVYNDLSNEKKLNVRVNILYLFGEYGANSLKDFQQVIPLLGIHSGFGNEWVKIGGIKIFADGIPPTRTAWMSQEYLEGGTGGLVLPGKTDAERANELKQMVRYAHKYGFQVGIHAIGDRAIEATIDSFIEAEKEEPKGLRHYVMHADFISPEYAKRAGENNIGACVQPGIPWTLIDFMDGIVGEKRADGQWPIKTLIDAGVHVSGSSDVPCTYPSWLQGVQSAVLRESKASGRVRGPEQRITREQAIRLYTTGGAWQDWMENTKGSIEVGKLADFCVLEENPLTIEPHKIKDIRNTMTIIGGKTVYSSGAD